MPYVRIWIHAVWSTKNRIPSLEKGIREKVFEHIKSNARKKKIVLDCINGYDDHVHCLIGLKKTQNLSSVMHLLKGESSWWINKERLCDHLFDWQDEYFAVSIGETSLENVRKYIANQEKHHALESSQQEYKNLIASLSSEDEISEENSPLPRD